MKGFYTVVMRGISLLAFPLTAIILHNSQRVRVLVRYQNHVLLQRTSVGNQKWGLPGGGVEKNETFESAAQRELREEVGITVAAQDLRRINQQPIASKRRWPTTQLTFYEVVLDQKTPPHISRPLEILDAKWCALSALPAERSETVDTAIQLAHKD